MKSRLLSPVLLSLLLASGVALGFRGTPPAATARPIVTARIVAVDAAAGGTSARVMLAATCPEGWENDSLPQQVIVRQDVRGGPVVVAFANFAGSDVGWACDGQEHAFELDLGPADGPWQAGNARANFDAAVTSGTELAADFARKHVRIR